MVVVRALGCSFGLTVVRDNDGTVLRKQIVGLEGGGTAAAGAEGSCGVLANGDGGLPWEALGSKRCSQQRRRRVPKMIVCAQAQWRGGGTQLKNGTKVVVTGSGLA